MEVNRQIIPYLAHQLAMKSPTDQCTSASPQLSSLLASPDYNEEGEAENTIERSLFTMAPMYIYITPPLCLMSAYRFCALSHGVQTWRQMSQSCQVIESEGMMGRCACMNINPVAPLYCAHAIPSPRRNQARTPKPRAKIRHISRISSSKSIQIIRCITLQAAHSLVLR